MENFGPVLCSCELYLQWKASLQTKETYDNTEKPRNLILDDVICRLKTWLNDCFWKEMTVSGKNHKIVWLDSHKMGRCLPKTILSCKFLCHLAKNCKSKYIIWKLHKKANVQGVRSCLISNNIWYPTLSPSQQSVAANAHICVLKHSISLILQLLSFLAE